MRTGTKKIFHGMAASAIAALLVVPAFSDPGVDFGMEDDLTVYGAAGTAVDPDLEVKGFAVFGATQTVYTGGAAGPGNVVVNGALTVSSGTYLAGSSTFTAAGNVFMLDGAAGQVLGKGSAGSLQWLSVSALGDSLGTHVATKTLDMASFNIVNVSSVNFKSKVFLASATAANYGGVYVSTNLYVAGKYYGDGSSLSGIGDNLGSHIATTTLQMDVYGINTSSVISAASYQINGGTMVAVLPGGNSIAYGLNAGRSNTTGGNSNVFIGNNAGYTNTTSDGNSFVGSSAGFFNAVGGLNTFIGSFAGYLHSVGDYNSFLGASAGTSDTTGNSNSFLGASAGYSNTTGNNNSFLGKDAGYFNTTGNDNSFLGFSAGYYTQAGSQNTILGYYAGNGASGQSYSSTTIMGAGAGYNLTTGSDNIFLGWQAGYSATTGRGNIVIGYDKRTSAPAASNELNIGGLLYGKLDARTVGISTRVPQAALDIVSTGTASNDIYSQIWRDSTGAPVASMTVTGRLYADASALRSLPAGGSGGDSLGTHIATQTLNMAGFQVKNVSTLTVTGNAFSVGGSTLTVAYGKVGVGSASPNAKLDVVGNELRHGPVSYPASYSTTNSGYLVLDKSGTAGDASIVLRDQGNARAEIGLVTDNDIHFKTVTGTYGSESFTDRVLIRATGETDAFGLLRSYATSGVAKVFAGNSDGASTGAALELTYDFGASLSRITSIERGNVYRDLILEGNALRFQSGVSAVSEAMRITPGGTVGIGAAAPEARLDMVSTGTASNIYAQIWRNGSGVVVGSMSSTGVMMASRFIGEGSGLSGVTATDNTKVAKAGDTMTGQLTTQSTITVQGSAFSVGGSTLVVADGAVGIGTNAPRNTFEVKDLVHFSTYNYSVSLGQQAGGPNTANNNVFLGYNAGFTHATGADNVFIGKEAGYYNTSGNWNFFLGSRSGLNSTGNNNIFIGSDAGYTTTTGNENTFIGSGAGYFNDDGFQNVFLGYQSGYHNTSGANNVFLGSYYVGYQNTSGHDNTFVGGQFTGDANTTGSENAFFGSYAGQGNTTGSANSFFGVMAGESNTVGRYNSFFGNTSGDSNTTGESNSIVGYTAGKNNATGSANSIFGNEAGGAYGGSTNSFSSSTIMGYRAGYQTTTGSDNVFLGWQAGYGVTTGTGNIVIGYNKDTSAPAANNELNIGGLIYGKLDARTVGISTRVPQAALDIVSTGTASNDIYAQIWRDSTGAPVASMTVTGRLYADASALRSLPAGGSGGDSLGTHIATQTLQMQSFGINTSSAITAGYYQINGSTVVALLSGSGSLGIGPGTGPNSTGNYNLFVGSTSGYSNTTGANSVFVGYNSGRGNTTGAANTFIGSSAGTLNTTGNRNTAVGFAAGNKSTTGDDNSVLGNYAFFNSLVGSANVIVGRAAGGYGGGAGNSFSSSTIVGYQAGYNVTTGNDNTFLGWQAGYAVTTGTGNIIIGYNKDTSAPAANNELNIGGLLYGKLDARTVGISTRVPQAALDIVSTGTASNDIYAQIWRDSTGAPVASMTVTGRLYADASALRSLPAGGSGGDSLGTHIATQTLQMQSFGINTSSAITSARYQINGATVVAVLAGNGSLGVGTDAGRVNAGNFNTFVGNMAGAGNGGGSSNSFVGSYVGQNNTSGSFNSFLGHNSGGGNTTGDYNTFLGYGAGMSNSSAINNSFVGAEAGYNNSTGQNNAFFGRQAGYQNTKGAQNSVFGVIAGAANVTGENNSIFGYQSGYFQQTGSANSIFGMQAAFGASGQSFSSATLVGYKSGYSLTTGSDNIFLGWQAGYAVTSGTGNIVIGYNKDTSAPAANNELNIGGLIYGKLDARTVGISTRVPQAALDIVSTGTASNDIYAQIWRDSTGAPVASMTVTGRLYADASALRSLPSGDNLGTHVATKTLDMASFNIVNVSSVNFKSNVYVTSATAANYGGLYVSTHVYFATGADLNNVDAISGSSSLTMSSVTATGIGLSAAQLRFDAASNILISSESSKTLGGGVRISTNVYIVGVASAAYFYGNGAGLTGVPGDNLGSHIATTTLQMGAYGVNTSSNITAARYQINGSTMVAVLPGTDSIAYGIYSGTSNVSGSFNVFVGNYAGNSNTSGNGNSFLGRQAGNNNAMGSNNVFLGYQAGFSNTTGNRNATLGSFAGYNATRAEYNSFLGYNAGFYNVTGSGNAALGAEAGYGVSGNSYSSNTLVGYQSGYGLSTGSDNIFLGWQSGYSVTTGTGNIVIGYNKGVSAATASNELNIGNVLFGKLDAKTIGISTRVPQAALDIVSTGTATNIYAQIWRNGGGVVVASMTSQGVLYPTPSVSDNTKVAKTGDTMTGQLTTQSTITVTGSAFSVGGSTLAVVAGAVGIGTNVPRNTFEVKDLIHFSTYNYSVSLGQQAGVSNTAINNVFVGYNAGFTHATGADNVFIGKEAGYYNAAGSWNFFLGTRSGLNSTGDNNIFIGSDAGKTTTNGSENTFIGTAAGYLNTTGYENMFLGYYTGYNNLDAAYNTYTGIQAGFNNQTGNNNTIMGYQAGYGAASNSFSDSSIYGYKAGYNLSTGSGNILMGYQAGYSVTSGTGNIIIGYNIGPSGATANNEINIGGVYKGNVSSGTATIAKVTVQAADSGITLTSADYGKTITVNSASAQTVTLPSVTAADLGATITIVKLGAGKVTIQAAASSYIADSSAAGTLYNSAVSPAYASVTLVLVSSNRWMLVSGYGAWITT